MSLFALFVACSLSGLCGFLMGRSLPRSQSSAGTMIAGDQSSNDENLKNKQIITSMMVSLQDLANDVGSQVGRHAEQVSEFSATLDFSSSDDLQPLFSAGESLVTSSSELQDALAAAKKEIESQRSELGELIKEARTDALTGLPNRRAFDQEINRLAALNRRRGAPFSLIMIDIDRFKLLNDEHGHMIGDQVLKAFGRNLMTTFRDTDLVARYGGEEFAALLPQTNLKEALLAAERTRLVIESSPCAGATIELRITASIGVKEITLGETSADLLKRTDQALYAAKKGGRNCCYFHDGITTQPFVPTPIEVPTSELSDPELKSNSEGDDFRAGLQEVLS